MPYRKRKNSSGKRYCPKAGIDNMEFGCKKESLQPYPVPVFRSKKKNGIINKMKKQINKFEITGEESGIASIMMKATSWVSQNFERDPSVTNSIHNSVKS